LVLLALFVIGPILLFLTGALFSAVWGWSLTDDAARRAEGTPQAPAPA